MLLVSLLLWLLALWLYAPFFTRDSVLMLDRDALSMLGELRSSGSFSSWPNGYYFNSILVSLVTISLNILGVSFNDYVRAYQLIVWFAASIMPSILFLAGWWLTRKMLIPVVMAVILLFLPVQVQLLMVSEDNVISQVANLQFVLVYIWYTLNWREQLSWRDGLFILSLLTAIIAHHQLNILWVMPLSLFIFLRQYPRCIILKRVIWLYLGSGLLFMLLYIPLTALWAGAFRIADYSLWLLLWMVPNRFYQGYYFFNRFGWDIGRQLAEIGTGVSQVFLPNVPYRIWFLLVLILLMVLLFVVVVRRRKLDLKALILLIFVLVHIPHSLIYESANLERWDTPVAPLLLFLILLVTSSKWTRSNYLLVTGLTVLVLAGYLINYNSAVQYQQRATQDDVFQTLKPYFYDRTLAEAENDRQRYVLILPAAQFNRYFMVAEGYYDLRRDLFAVDDEEVFFMSQSLFPQPETVSREEFLGKTADALILYRPQEGHLLNRILSAE